METRIVLGEKEFTILVSGGVVEIEQVIFGTNDPAVKVKIILSDIGWHKMLEILAQAILTQTEIK